MTAEDFRLAVASLETFSDEEITRLLLDVEITCEKDIFTVVGALEFHRPALAKKLEAKVKTV